MDAFEAFKARITAINPPDPSVLGRPLPTNIFLPQVVPRNYQEAGINWLMWLHENQLSGILADEMGLGKTLQAIGMISHLISSGRKPALVVVPLSVIHNWKTEFSKFNSIPVTLLVGGSEERQTQKRDIQSKIQSLRVLITTYEIAMIESDFIGRLCDEWEYLVVDEAHRLKNCASQLHQKLLMLNCRGKLLLTGTPVQNNLAELQSLLSFANPDIFRNCEFTEWFQNDALHDMDLLTEWIRPFILRRLKKDVVQLPQMKQFVIQAPLTNIQRKLYISILHKEYAAFNPRKKPAKLNNVLMQLRKCVAHPYLFDGVEKEPFEAGEHLVTNSSKMIVLDQILVKARRMHKRVLVFSQWTRVLDIIQDYLTYREFPYERLDGSVRAEERFLSISRFQKTDSQTCDDEFVFLLTTRAGGVGLNLTAADTVVFMDMDFNPTVDEQAAARIHRIGQTKETTLIRIVAPNTVDDVIWRRSQKKLKLQNRIMAEGTMQDISSGNEDQTADWKPKETKDLVSIIQFGVNKLILQPDDECVNVGPVPEIEAIFTSQDTDAITSADASPSSYVFVKGQDENSIAMDGTSDEDSIYYYEGRDYKAELEAIALLRKQTLDPTNSLVGHKRGIQDIDDAEQLIMLQERRQRSELIKKKKRFERFSANNYVPLSLDEDGRVERLSTDEDKKIHVSEPQKAVLPKLEENVDDVMADDGSERQFLVSVSGDATRPILDDPTEAAITVHVCDNSGAWPNLGMFRAISSLDSSIQSYYEQSSESTIRNLRLGSAHLIPVSLSKNKYVCLVIAQRSTNRHAFDMNALSHGLELVAKAAGLLGASVHLPRIGQQLHQVDWYSVERLIRKVFVPLQINTKM